MVSVPWKPVYIWQELLLLNLGLGYVRYTKWFFEELNRVSYSVCKVNSHIFS